MNDKQLERLLRSVDWASLLAAEVDAEADSDPVPVPAKLRDQILRNARMRAAKESRRKLIRLWPPR